MQELEAGEKLKGSGLEAGWKRDGSGAVPTEAERKRKGSGRKRHGNGTEAERKRNGSGTEAGRMEMGIVMD